MRTTTTSLKKWLLLLAMALVGCDYEGTPKYPCAVIITGTRYIDDPYFWCDSAQMVTTTHVLAYRDGYRTELRNTEPLYVFCTMNKRQKP
jgi:hypothetical protein